MKITYNPCEKHQNQLLFEICIDANCHLNQKLFCCFCESDHMEHRHITLQEFLLEFQQQFKKHQQEEEDYFDQHSFNKTFAKMNSEILRAKEQICSRLDQLLELLKQEQKKYQAFKDPSYDEIAKILTTIGTSQNMAELIGTLTKQIESLQPSGGNLFVLKKNAQNFQNMKEKFKESEILVKHYLEFKEQYLSEFENQITLLCDQIQNLCGSYSKEQPQTVLNHQKILIQVKASHKRLKH